MTPMWHQGSTGHVKRNVWYCWNVRGGEGQLKQGWGSNLYHETVTLAACGEQIRGEQTRGTKTHWEVVTGIQARNDLS